MKLALLLMALLMSGCVGAEPIPNPHSYGWTSPNMAREGREAPIFLEIE